MIDKLKLKSLSELQEIEKDLLKRKKEKGVKDALLILRSEINVKIEESPTQWGGDVARGLAASGMQLSKKDKAKKDFNPMTGFGAFIKQVVNKAVKEAKEKHGITN